MARLRFSTAVPRDEINPDVLIVQFANAIGILESQAEDEGVAMDWETLQVGLVQPAVPDIRKDYVLVNANVQSLS